MAKARFAPDENDPGRGRRLTGGSGDPLGKLLEEYRVSLVGAVLVSGVVGLIGLGVVVYAWTRQPPSLNFLLLGAGVLFFALVVLVINVFNVGRRRTRRI